MDPIRDLPTPPPSVVVDNEWSILLWIVGGIAILFVGYLLTDSMIVRRRNRRLQQLRGLKKD